MKPSFLPFYSAGGEEEEKQFIRNQGEEESHWEPSQEEEKKVRLMRRVEKFYPDDEEDLIWNLERERPRRFIPATSTFTPPPPRLSGDKRSKGENKPNPP